MGESIQGVIVVLEAPRLAMLSIIDHGGTMAEIGVEIAGNHHKVMMKRFSSGSPWRSFGYHGMLILLLSLFLYFIFLLFYFLFASLLFFQ